jgi:rubrerythrin
MMSHLTLSAEQKLSLAIVLEAAKAEHNHIWSLCFRGFDPGASTMLEALSEDEASQARELARLYEERFGTPPTPVDTTLVDEILPYSNDLSGRPTVFDETTGRIVLEAILLAEQSTCAFFESLVANTTDAALRGIFRPLLGTQCGHVDVLRETLESY